MAPEARDDALELSPLNSPVYHEYTERLPGFVRSASGSPPTSHRLKLPKSTDDNAQTCTSLLVSYVWTIIFEVALVVVVKIYESKGVLTDTQKDTFNTITTGLILFLGLSFYEAFKGFAKAFRPRLKKWFDPNPHASHLIDEFDSLLNVTQLLLGRVGLGLRLFCLLWVCVALRDRSLYFLLENEHLHGALIADCHHLKLFLNIAAQIAAAIISLTYSLVDGNDYNGIYVRNGPVKVSNLSCYMHNKGCPPPVTVDALSHAYGDSTLGPDSIDPTDCGYFENATSVMESQQNFNYYCRRNTTTQEFAYRFNEYNWNDTQKVYPYFTNRVMTASSGICNEYSQIGDGNQTVVGDTSGLNFVSALNFTYTNNATYGTIAIPNSALGLAGTTYIYRGIQTPANTTVSDFGPRGLWMWAYRNSGGNQDPRFYECPVTVSAVTNVADSRHNVSDALARQAVASIALQGQFKGSFSSPDFTQWQWYASGHPWEIHSQNQSRVGANIAEHAIASLAEMVDQNSPITLNGTVPHLGTKLEVEWKYFDAIMVVVAAADTFVVVVAFMAGRSTPSGKRI